MENKKKILFRRHAVNGYAAAAGKTVPRKRVKSARRRLGPADDRERVHVARGEESVDKLDVPCFKATALI